MVQKWCGAFLNLFFFEKTSICPDYCLNDLVGIFWIKPVISVSEKTADLSSLTLLSCKLHVFLSFFD